MNFIDPTQLTEDEVNELFETKTISQTNANQNAKASNLLLNLASLYHQKYQEETQKMKKAETEIKDNERQIGHKASEIRKLKQKIAELQKEKEMQSRKEKRDKFDKKDKKDKFQKPKRSAFEKPKNDKFSYTPPSNQSQPTNSSTAQSAPVIEKRQKKPYREMQMVYCPPQNDKPSQNEQSSNSKQPEKQVLVEKSKFHYTAAVSDTPEPQKQPAQETDTTKDSP
ncbi:hypothetical protein TRFO_11247 [Tritrichomonas foetus]|uniref:Uncharacterized protein n=1 Tax=Tritrichomonas foetus TaxID=1144522 RepID=A0A1J4J9S4_9EUKA|nr:hypothetical protein TRFO_11247 [Tritrichomonas foetus]|eukprot:OHS94189.1 hypothetical protein TRFO_11247 [Tritrichomonas foetus]